MFAAACNYQVFLLALTVLPTTIVLMGLVYREKHGIANIGMESFIVLALYLGAVTLLFYLR